MKSVPKLQNKSKLRTAIATGSFTTIGGLLGWLGTTALRDINEIERVAIDSQARIERLEKDDAKWATLAELKRDITKLQVDVEVFRRLYRTVTARAVPVDDTVEVPTAEEEKHEVNPDSFRKIQENRFPSKR